MFYEYRQNNSGGYFQNDKAIREVVIIEADSYEEANEIAEDLGIYFDGCDTGRDCSCCGDRWYEQYSEDDGREVPSYYGIPISEIEEDYEGSYFAKDCIVYYKNGTTDTQIVG